jgi:hypothetical protein
MGTGISSAEHGGVSLSGFDPFDLERAKAPAGERLDAQFASDRARICVVRDTGLA